MQMFASEPCGATYYLSPSLRSMPKTNNFNPFLRPSQIFLTICLLAVCGSNVFPQTGNTKTAPSSPPAATNKNEPAQPSRRVVSSSKASQTVIDPSLPDDAAVLKMLEPYSGKVRALDAVIGQLDGELKKAGLGAGNLGNL